VTFQKERVCHSLRRHHLRLVLRCTVPFHQRSAYRSTKKFLFSAESSALSNAGCIQHPPPACGRSLSSRSSSSYVPDRMIATCLGPFHRRYPFIVVTVQCQVQVWAGAVRLGADRQLSQHAAHGFGPPTIARASYRLLETFVRLARIDIRRRRTGESRYASVRRVRRRRWIAEQVAEALVERQEIVGRAVVGAEDAGVDHVVDDEERRLRVRIRNA
jgi:hypothetical protein